jgi:hypothetical protein
METAKVTESDYQTIKPKHYVCCLKTTLVYTEEFSKGILEKILLVNLNAY